MRAAIIGAALLAGACSGGQAEEEGPGAQRSFEVAAFDRIELAGSHDVVVTVGGPPSVRAEGRERALDRLEIAVEGGRLQIRSRPRSGWLAFGSDRGVTVYVTVPTIAGVDVAGSGGVRVDRIEGASFDASLAGSGDLEVSRLRVEMANFGIAGSGNVRAAGAAGRTVVEIAGSGDVDLSGLRSRTAAVSVAGSGNVRLHAAESADVTLMGSGDVTVSGGARCNVDKHGSGDVHCG